MNIIGYRLYNQQIAQHAFDTPGHVTAWLGAVQAQDFAGAKWSIGLRLAGATEADIIQAITNRTIVRTWPMRGTLHFVAAADVRWMLALMTPRIIAGTGTRVKQLELDDAIFERTRKLFAQVLKGGKQLTREEMYEALDNAGISTERQRGYHLLWRMAQEGLICFSSPQDKQPTFALLDEWLPAGKQPDRDASLAELTRRYFTGHGPATLHDFAWWSGLTMTDVRAGLSMAGSELVKETVNGTDYWMASNIATPPPDSGTWLLPGFDEYLLGYKDRSAVLDPAYNSRIVPGGNGMFMPTVVLDGRVVGTWKRTFRKSSALVEVRPFTSLTTKKQGAVDEAAERYGAYIGMPVAVKHL